MCRQSTLLEAMGWANTDEEQNSNGRIILQWEHLCELDDDRGMENYIGLKFGTYEAGSERGDEFMIPRWERTHDSKLAAYWSTGRMHMIPFKLEHSICQYLRESGACWGEDALFWTESKTVTPILSLKAYPLCGFLAELPLIGKLFSPSQDARERLSIHLGF